LPIYVRSDFSERATYAGINSARVGDRPQKIRRGDILKIRKPITEKVLAANRARAKKSAGPKTASGKNLQKVYGEGHPDLALACDAAEEEAGTWFEEWDKNFQRRLRRRGARKPSADLVHALRSDLAQLAGSSITEQQLAMPEESGKGRINKAKGEVSRGSIHLVPARRGRRSVRKSAE
jgi:hypothetical protein